MAEHDHDFMGRSLGNYDTAENRMSDSDPGGGRGGNHSNEGKQLYVCGKPVGLGRLGLGLAVLIIGLIIIVALRDIIYASAVGCFVGLAGLAGIFAAAFSIWLKK